MNEVQKELRDFLSMFFARIGRENRSARIDGREQLHGERIHAMLATDLENYFQIQLRGIKGCFTDNEAKQIDRLVERNRQLAAALDAANECIEEMGHAKRTL